MITSANNNWVKLARQLHKTNKRKKLKKYLLEGKHLVLEAISAQKPLIKIFYTKSESEFIASYAENYDIEEVTPDILKMMVTTQTPQGIVAVADEPEPLSINQILDNLDDQLILGIDKVQDPGNLGTIIRTSDAAGIKHIFLNKGTVDIYNPKVLRSMQGSQYHVQIHYVDFTEFLPKLKQKNYDIYATALDKTAMNYKEIKIKHPSLVVMGNEGQGVDNEILEQSQKVYIPILGQAESLNVAVATGIILFDWI